MFSRDRRGFLQWFWQFGSVAALACLAKGLGAQAASNPKDKSGNKTETLEEKVRRITLNTLRADPKKVTPTARFCEDLGADSLDQVELCMAFEEAFGIEIPDSDCQRIDSLNDAVHYIKTHPKKDAATPKSK